MIVTLLKNNRDLFKVPRKLPPKWDIDHNINISEDQPPMNICPYKYEHKQKEEIEKLVEESYKLGLSDQAATLTLVQFCWFKRWKVDGSFVLTIEG